MTEIRVTKWVNPEGLGPEDDREVIRIINIGDLEEAVDADDGKYLRNLVDHIVKAFASGDIDEFLGRVSIGGERFTVSVQPEEDDDEDC